jgi:hypothetical protein
MKPRDRETTHTSSDNRAVLELDRKSGVKVIQKLHLLEVNNEAPRFRPKNLEPPHLGWVEISHAHRCGCILQRWHKREMRQHVFCRKRHRTSTSDNIQGLQLVWSSQLNKNKKGEQHGCVVGVPKLLTQAIILGILPHDQDSEEKSTTCRQRACGVFIACRRFDFFCRRRELRLPADRLPAPSLLGTTLKIETCGNE